MCGVKVTDTFYNGTDDMDMFQERTRMCENAWIIKWKM